MGLPPCFTVVSMVRLGLFLRHVDTDREQEHKDYFCENLVLPINCIGMALSFEFLNDQYQLWWLESSLQMHEQKEK
jgi:hypothetical protein